MPRKIINFKDDVPQMPAVHEKGSQEVEKPVLRSVLVGRRAKSIWGRFRNTFSCRFPKCNAPESSNDDRRFRIRHVHQRHQQSFVQRTSSEAPHRVDASRFWAVLIGIDAYKNSLLRGCVSDAFLMKTFLIDNLGVPECRIQCLLGSHDLVSPDDPSTPSRANIVNTLYSLIDNREIQTDDNIIIYYAGHGSSYCCSDHLHTGESTVTCSTELCSIEALCPIDRDSIDNSGLPIPDISDRELNAIFGQISRVKGHKITFIVDCCHSCSFDRRASGSGVRTIPITTRASLEDMFHAADERLKYLPCYLSVSSEDWKPDMGSHVILAACRDFQLVREIQVAGKDGYGGVFTNTLVGVLTSGAWKKETTYVGLTELLNQSYAQTPVVAGDRKYERLWYQV